MKQQLLDLANNLGATLKALSMYAPEHQGVQRHVGVAFETIAEVTAQRGELSFGIVEDMPVIGDVPIYDITMPVEQLQKHLEKLEVNLIKFTAGISTEELTKAFAIIAKAAAGIGDDLDKQLQDAGVEHVACSDIDDINERAREVYSNAKTYVQEIMAEARAGKIPEGKKAKRLIDDMDSVISEDPAALMCLTLLSDYDNYTFNHSVNVGVLSLSLATYMGFTGDEAKAIGLSGLLHDVGKTRTPLEIINKPGKLTPDEWNIMKRHPLEGADIIKQMDGINDQTFEAVRLHHAKYNNEGYPKAAGPGEAPIGSYIVAAADTYDSMTTLRPYQKRYSPDEALQVMNKLKGSVLAPKVVDAFMRMLGIFPVGSLVRLDTNELAMVIGVNQSDDSRPRVKVIADPTGKVLYDDHFDVDLTERAGEQYKRTALTTVDPMTKNIDLSRFATQITAA